MLQVEKVIRYQHRDQNMEFTENEAITLRDQLIQLYPVQPKQIEPVEHFFSFENEPWVFLQGKYRRNSEAIEKGLVDQVFELLQKNPEKEMDNKLIEYSTKLEAVYVSRALRVLCQLKKIDFRRVEKRKLYRVHKVDFQPSRDLKMIDFCKSEPLEGLVNGTLREVEQRLSK